MRCIFNKPFNSHQGRFPDREEVEVPDSLVDALPSGTEIVEPPKVTAPPKAKVIVKAKERAAKVK
tara:strand:+ start:239 stop:433 length:195 start_codon:yes stop_codon:yes gene_type:complete